MAANKGSQILRVGIIGCGEITQIVHIPTINCLSHCFKTTCLCDVSPMSPEHCRGKVLGGAPSITADSAEHCASPEVDVVIIANADAYHVEHGLLALQNDKYCIIEKPLARSFQDIDRLIEAEKKSRGKVMVGTMRRFATAFTDAVAEVGGMSEIMYARVRDIIGPNFNFVNQSGTYPQRFTDYKQEDTDDRVQREAKITHQALCTEFGVAQTAKSEFLLRALGGLGTHDLSAMREILGMPQGVAGSHVEFTGWPGIFNVLFKYEGFAVSYETGVHQVPEFDAHIEVYGLNKIVRVDFDTPYLKGLPTTMTVKELLPGGGYQERLVRKTYADN
ncbi:oxidoreductase [Penicillium herquei]|nr:oxidoreductase [Penicillium herquei]